MIQKFVSRFLAEEAAIKANLKDVRPEDYDDLVGRVIVSISNEGDYRDPDPERIHVIDDGNYQGLRLFIIGAKGYQPSMYWSIAVDYGSCSGCDSFEAVRSYRDEIVDDKEVEAYWTMMLHMVQSMKQVCGFDEED